MRINVLFFASLADIVGSRNIELELVEGGTVDDVLTRLESEYPRMRDYRSFLLTAVNEQYVDRAHRVADGDEVAIFPPVSGGSASREDRIRELPNQFYLITNGVIDAASIGRDLLDGGDGAICTFEGVVRNNSKGRETHHLVYESYENMALAKLAEIGEKVRETWDIDSIGIAHRLGRLEVGETSVAVIVTSAHRRAAFDACHYAIDRLKKIVPIWKKEYFADGEGWIEGQDG